MASGRGDIDRREIGKSNRAAFTPRQYEIPEPIGFEQTGKTQRVLTTPDIELPAGNVVGCCSLRRNIRYGDS